MEELWFILLVTISLALLLKAFLDLLSPSKSPPPLPPGPFSVPILSQFLWIRKISSEMEPILRSLHAKLGPIIALNIVSRPSIFISDRSLAYQALIQNGLVFSDRPEPLATGKVLSCNQHNINSAGYGPTWRLLRRNLTSQILHPHRIKSYSRARNSVLQILFDNLDSESKNGGSIRIMAHLQYAMFCLLVLLCFGDQVSEEQIKQIEVVQREVLLNSGKFNYLNFWPKLTRLLLGKKWEQFLNIRKSQQQVLIPLIRARREYKNDDDDDSLTYVDTLLDLKLPEEDNNRMRRQLSEEEMVALCSEFLNAGTDTTSTALQWIMANLVKYPHIQDKLFREIQGVVVVGEEIKEDDLQKMPYLKAVVLEGLRRHPPGHFVLPHTVTEDTVLGGYLVPKGSNINFMVADMGWDPQAWEDPMAFKPERFDGGGGQVFDITASKGEIKMMPFGAGRRICPGIGLAMLHLEYFVANLVWKFEWKAVEGDEVSLDEKQEFTIVMKYPLQAHISPRERRK